jgi:small subunit ribosomal protein S6e
MANIKLNIGDPKSKKTFQIELDEQGTAKLQGKKLGETFKGELIDKPGYEFQIKGGSDAAGFPMRNDIDGVGRRKILIIKGIGNRSNRKGMRLRRTVAGSTVGPATVQINAKITKHGPKPLKEETEKKEEKAA